MNWPKWAEVLPLLTVIAAMFGGLLVVMQLSDRAVTEAVALSGRESDRIAREAMAEVRAEVKAVEERLGARIDRLGARLDARIDGLGARIERSEARLLAAIQALEGR